jgi:hypothetical protein
MSTTSTHHDLWAGIDLKLSSASFHFEGMNNVLKPPALNGHYAALASAGAVIGRNWHQAFYAHLDAFLSTARSVPELIRCCFGVDDGHREMRNWFADLDLDEQRRRREFGDKFKADYDTFRALALGTARHISEHRTGVAPVTVTVTGRFGVTYKGGPTKPVPTSEAREMPPELGWMQTHLPVQPTWRDFDIDGKSLFEAFNVRATLSVERENWQRRYTAAANSHPRQTKCKTPSTRLHPPSKFLGRPKASLTTRCQRRARPWTRVRSKSPGHIVRSCTQGKRPRVPTCPRK